MLGDIIPFIFGLDPPKVAFVGDISPFMGKSGIYEKNISFWKKNYIFLKLTVAVPEIWDTLEIKKMKICSEVPNFMGKMNFR